MLIMLLDSEEWKSISVRKNLSNGISNDFKDNSHSEKVGPKFIMLESNFNKLFSFYVYDVHWFWNSIHKFLCSVWISKVSIGLSLIMWKSIDCLMKLAILMSFNITVE
jgi:hypothetical protein